VSQTINRLAHNPKPGKPGYTKMGRLFVSENYHAMSYCRLFYHFVWATKERLPLITEVNREPIYAAISLKEARLTSRLKNENATFAWQSEYGAVSLSESHLPVVVRYVRSQQQHHAARTLSDYPKNLPKGVSEGKNPPASRFASVGPLCQRGQRRRSRAGDLSSTAEQKD
jgi:putative transposase